MQYFGELITKYEEVFLTSSYLYFNNEDEKITPKEFKEKIKNTKVKKKNIIGTIVLYNPVVTPVGYDSNKFLLEQDFDSFDQLIELKTENYITTFKHALKEQCAGKVVEIINLFNLVEKKIDASTLLMKFNEDLEKYNSMQNTEFDRDIMYLDAANIIPSGKFVFFSWGDKINSTEFPYIHEYAKTLFDNVTNLGKKVSYVYREEKGIEHSEKYLQFSFPDHNPKYKSAIENAIRQSFKEFPPSKSFY